MLAKLLAVALTLFLFSPLMCGKKKEVTIKSAEARKEEEKNLAKEMDFRKWAKNAPATVRKIHKQHGSKIKHVAKRQKVDPKLITAIIAVESGGNPKAVSPKGAKGLTQLRPLAAKEVEVRNVFHPYENILGGAKYLKRLHRHYGFRDVNEVLVAYNQGPKNASDLLNSGYNPREDFYVKKVHLAWHHAKSLDQN